MPRAERAKQLSGSSDTVENRRPEGKVGPAGRRARPRPDSEIPQVRVVRAVPPVVPEHDEVSVAVPPSCVRNDSVTGRFDPCPDRGSIVDPLMRAPLLENRMAAHAESRGDTREL